ncbi:MAG: YchF/TatD family DNA exonuclease [Nitrospiraceae bacterium]|nr:YchF/TatD family DNA exonuclease [Nitrospiraceae bacterium]
MLIDTHAHLEMREFNDDREDVIKRAREAGVEYIITIGTTIESSRDAVLLADKYDFIYAAIGIHPHEVRDILHPAYEIIRHFAQHKKVVAYGEIGLDYHYEHSSRTDQKRKFRDMLREARELELPVIIHDRDAHEDTMQILSEEWSPDLGGVMHCFSGDLAMAERLIEMGFSLSIAGPVTFPKAEALREVVRQIPIEHLLIETDSPYLAPQPVRGKRNEPAFVRHTAEAIAKIKGLSFDDVARITSFNAMQLFGIGTIPERGQITYPIRNSLYLNITNRCTASCTFCVRYHTDFVKGHNLRLGEEPTADALIKEIGDPKQYAEIVFCGYGEPLLRLDVVKAVAAAVKERGGKVRIDTNGHGNLIYKRNILPELSGLVDGVSVSLNAQNAETYVKISQPKFGIETYEAVKEFLREAKKYISDVTATVVAAPEVDVEACRRIAEELGVKFRVREYNVVG